jgi:hypothetical protein
MLSYRAESHPARNILADSFTGHLSGCVGGTPGGQRAHCTFVGAPVVLAFLRRLSSNAQIEW